MYMCCLLCTCTYAQMMLRKCISFKKDMKGAVLDGEFIYIYTWDAFPIPCNYSSTTESFLKDVWKDMDAVCCRIVSHFKRSQLVSSCLEDIQI